MVIDQLAKQIVEVVLRDLKGRHSVGDALGEIDANTWIEMESDLRHKVAELLPEEFS